MEHITLVNGAQVRKKAMEDWMFGKMKVMKENGQMELKWEKDFINGKMEISTVETLQMI